MAKSLEQQLKGIENDINKIINTNATMSSVFSDAFFRKHTKFTSLDDFFDQGNFRHETKEDIDGIDEHDLDVFIKNNTKFKSWNEMKQSAGNDYARAKLEKAGIRLKSN